MSTMQDVFNALALQLMTPPDELAKYANEDQLGGYSPFVAKPLWPMGSLWEEEGKILYALIRKYKPQRIVEIGTLRGCSTAHMAIALEENGGGHITAIDIAANAGDLFPQHLKAYVTSVTGDGLAWLAGQEDESIDMLFEDSSHGTDMCAAVAALCKDKLKPGGLFITHDAAHDFSIDGNGNKAYSPVGAEIRAGLTRALKDEYRVYLASPSDCGFALWRKPVEVKSFKLTGYSLEPDGTIMHHSTEPMGYELQALADVHSQRIDISTGKPGAAKWTALDAMTDFQSIDHEFKSREHLPPEDSEANKANFPRVSLIEMKPGYDAPRVIAENSSENPEVLTPVEPPKKKRGRPSKKSKEE